MLINCEANRFTIRYWSRIGLKLKLLPYFVKHTRQKYDLPIDFIIGKNKKVFLVVLDFLFTFAPKSMNRENSSYKRDNYEKNTICDVTNGIFVFLFNKCISSNDKQC